MFYIFVYFKHLFFFFFFVIVRKTKLPKKPVMCGRKKMITKSFFVIFSSNRKSHTLYDNHGVIQHFDVETIEIQYIITSENFDFVQKAKAINVIVLF